jgi:UDP-glucose 4-epimerase
MTNWCITGGCGFLGVNLISRLREVQPNCAIRVVDNLSESRREDLAAVTEFREIGVEDVEPIHEPGVELVVADIRDRESSVRVVEGASAVVHFAACTGVLPSLEDPETDCGTNVLGTLNYLMAARDARCKAFIFASSGAPLGEQEPPIHEEKVPRPVSPYGASKLSGEAYCSAFYGSFGLPTLALRFGNVYGPRSEHKNSIVAKFIKLALDGQSLVIYGNGSQTRDFVFVDDLVEAVRAAAASGIGGEVFQIATHRETSVSELTAVLSELLRERAGIDTVVEFTEPMAGEIQRNFSDISKARRFLGWKPQVELRDGLRRTVDWFLAQRSDAI